MNFSKFSFEKFTYIIVILINEMEPLNSDYVHTSVGAKSIIFKFYLFVYFPIFNTSIIQFINTN